MKTNLLDELEAFKIDLNAYWNDLEPQSIIDSVRTGKINALLAFCRSYS